MMNILEEAIIYATVMYQGKERKLRGTPYILHPMEVAQILSTMTDDEEIITAGILHDIVEDTDGTLAEIQKRFGDRVANLVSSESENEYPGEDPAATWKRRKEESIRVLKNSRDDGVKMLWLADKLSNIRSLASVYSERGEALWQVLHQKDPAMQRWYYKSIAEVLELTLNRTGAFKEFIKHVNFIWPGTFDSDKARYKKYREVSVDGCKLIGRGAKGEVYRYDEELIIKVYNENNTYHDVEQEIALARKAFILGIPTAISFGIVSVGPKYGAMYEIIDSDTVSTSIARSPSQVEVYADIMADLARTVHSIEISEKDGFPYASDRLKSRVRAGIESEDKALSERCMALINTLPETNTLVHGDYHTGNVFLQKGEPILIDMDRLSSGHPMTDISGMYYYYVVLGEDDPSVIENFMGFSYDTSKRFFNRFIRRYLGTEDESVIRDVTDKIAFVSYIRYMNKLHKKVKMNEHERALADSYLAKILELADRLETLDF